MNQRTIVWRREPLENIATIVRGITFASSDKVTPGTEGAIPCLRTSNVQESLEIDDLLWVSETFVKRQEQWLQAGDTIISMANSHELVGKVAFNPGQSHKMSFGGFIAAIRPHEITAKYLYFAMKSPGVQSAIRRLSSQTVNIANISAGILRNIQIPVVSADEQHKIVATIETNFSRLDAASVSLKRAKANLKRARASVLKAAVEGRLVPTEAALVRSGGRSYEPGSTLLARILTERRARCVDGKARDTYKEPVAADLDGVGQLPLGWAWGSCDQVGEILLGRRRAPEYTGAERSYLRVANVKDGLLYLGDVQRMPFEDAEFEKYQLKTGDVLVSEGQSPELVGQSALYLGAPSPCAFQATLHRFRPDSTSVLPRYAETVFRAWVRGGVFRKRCIVTTNIGHLTLGRFKSVPFPLPPLAEQHRIVAEVDRRLSVLDAIELTVNADLARCVRLRQSILKRAFEGRLVPIEPVRTGEPQLAITPQDAAR